MVASTDTNGAAAPVEPPSSGAPAPADAPPIGAATPMELPSSGTSAPWDSSSVAPADNGPISIQTIANAYGDYTKKSFQETGSFVEKLMAVRSFD
jgi:hypothetical protein